MCDERAQSEVLGYVFVFSIIALTTTTVYAGGVASLLDVQDDQRVDNAVRSVEVVADDLDEVVRGAPSRSTELKLDSASVTTGDPVTIEVSGQNVSDPSESFSESVEVDPIVYRTHGTTIVYVSGLVIREEPEGRVAVRDVGFVLHNERTVLPVVQTVARSDRSLGGVTRVRAHAERSGVRTLGVGSGSGPYDVTVTVTSPRADVWHRTLDARPGVSCTMSAANQVECDVTTDRVTAMAVQVNVWFEA